MVDQTSRSAARVAALVAVPVALLTGLATFALLSGSFAPAAAPDPTPSATGTAPAPAPVPVPTTPVEMAAPRLTGDETLACRALLSRLPAALDELPQRPVSDGPEQNAAYGEPPITVACGAPAADYQPTDPVQGLSGVCWYAAEEPDATVWTTLDRVVPVRVRVPDAYPAPGQRVIEFSPVIVETIRSSDTAPSGCTP